MPVRMQASYSQLGQPLVPVKPTAEPAMDPESLEELKGADVRDRDLGDSFSLVPGMGRTETMLRWGFIRKVYGIIAAQLVLTSIVAAAIMFHPSVQLFVTTSMPFQLTFAILPLLGLIPLYIYQKKHPHNLIILALWTAALSVGVGTACTAYQPLVVLEALVLTATLVTGLSLYTFVAVRKGASFGWMGPMLFTGLLLLLGWGFVQLLLPVGPASRTVWALLGALLFCGYLIFDTDNLIQRYDLDEYVWASVNLYLDIINLFLHLLHLLSRRD